VKEDERERGGGVEVPGGRDMTSGDSRLGRKIRFSALILYGVDIPRGLSVISVSQV